MSCQRTANECKSVRYCLFFNHYLSLYLEFRDVFLGIPPLIFIAM